jgi:hypothetical protein
MYLNCLKITLINIYSVFFHTIKKEISELFSRNAKFL